jgi:REP element-mobilizing transposase RayT
MNRGTNWGPIFLQNGDRDIFLKTLGESVALWNIRVHAFSLMDNHYHLLLETPLGNLSRAMRHINGVFTQRINRKWERDGSLMRGRFKSILIEQDHYFLEVIR